MDPRRNAAFGFAASVALHGAAVAAALAFGGGWWSEARLAMGTAAPTPTLWPVVWIDAAPEPQAVAEPSPEPAREWAAAEAAAPAPKLEKIEAKPQAKAPADNRPADISAAEPAAAEASDPAPPAETEQAQSSQAVSGEGAAAT